MHTDLNHRTVAERLRALPEEAQAPYDWDQFQRRARERNLAGVHGNRRYGAIAAAVVIVVAGLAVWGRFTGHWSLLPTQHLSAGQQPSPRGPRASDGQAESNGSLASNGPPGIGASTAGGRDARQFVAPQPRDGASARDSALSAVAESGRSSESRGHLLEVWLASLPQEPVVVRVGTRAAAAGLEDRIAQIDDLLSVERVDGSRPARLATLQQERTQLMSSLVQVRYAETLVAASR